MFSRLLVNEPYYLEVLVVDEFGVPVNGVFINYEITKLPNLLCQFGLMEYAGEGIYQKVVHFSEIGQYRIYYKLPIGYQNKIETVLVSDMITIGRSRRINPSGG